MNNFSLFKIIKNDYGTFIMSIAGPVMMGISLYILIFNYIPTIRGRGGIEVDSQFGINSFYFSLSVTIILLFFLAKRISKIKNLLMNGPRISATITSVSFFKDRGRVDFEYTYHGRKFQAGTSIMKNPETETLLVGQKIDIAMEVGNPKKVFVLKLFK